MVTVVRATPRRGVHHARRLKGPSGGALFRVRIEDGSGTASYPARVRVRVRDGRNGYGARGWLLSRVAEAGQSNSFETGRGMINRDNVKGCRGQAAGRMALTFGLLGPLCY